uniref:ATP synthase complex subunit 8 n=1 Tax=Polyphylla gracilicornis TaxID=1618307 RepID=A0A7S9H414_9SCAR|nr:ATP synthase F0 subunit 8 [Polyphylla gracilicornis]QPF96298.1 ATP synthase F0 subunit 8 [Polyphylla gracilicornis]
MPQMAPLNWLGLFVTFIIVLLMFNSMNYFSLKYLPKSHKPQKLSGNISWKW